MSRSHRHSTLSAEAPRQAEGRLPWPAAVLAIAGVSAACWLALAILLHLLFG